MATTQSSSTPRKEGRSGRGFAGMDPERQREISSEGGRAAHEKGTAHEFTSEEARIAGSKSHSGRQSAAARAREEKAKSSQRSSANQSHGEGDASANKDQPPSGHSSEQR
ncbi:MAG: KGG domain-containing protein [Pseudomonadota bacterium]